MANITIASVNPESGSIHIAGAEASTTPGNNNDLKYVYQIRDQFYHLETWMYNQFDDYKPFQVSFFSIEALALEETLFNWPTNGWMVLKNDFELFERGSLPVDNIAGIPAPYIFRSDGRNRINIKIYPIPNPAGIVGESIDNQELPRDLWEMNFDFVIYDIEDLPTDNNQNKLRKLYFHDERIQILKERNIQWSTAKYGPNQGQLGTTDKARAMPVSDAMKSIIQTAGSSKSDPLFSDLNVGYNESLGSISDPKIPLASFGDWDEGHAPNGEPVNILYTSPAGSNALEDLSYLYQNAVSSDGTPLILDFGRTTDDKKFHLRPLSYFFKNAEKNQIEKLILVDGISPDKALPYIPRAPNMAGTAIQNFTSGIASLIKSYNFAPMVATDDAKITNKPLHNFNFANSEFNIYYEDNTAEKISKNMEDMAKQGLYGLNNGGQLLMNINKTKQTGLMNTPYFESQTFFPKNKPAMLMMKQALFLNQALYFQVPGLTFRTPGKFIFVDRTSSSDNNPFDDRFLGQWMIIKVVHLFTKDNYVNDVVATKIDTFKKMWPILDKK